MFFHDVVIQLSGKYLVYSLASVFEMVSSPAFNVSMFMWSLPVAVPFFISRSAASISHDIISFWSLWIKVIATCTKTHFPNCSMSTTATPSEIAF